MEAFLLLAAIIIGLAAFDVLALEFGTDSRSEARDERVRLIDRGSIA